MPLAVVLPRSTEDVSKVLKYCYQNQLKVVPRGAGYVAVGRRAAGRGRDRHRHLAHEPRARSRLRSTASSRSRPASPISPSPKRCRREGFFYAPDPSSQLACTLGGNLAMNSGGAHCLKYGVTTNNVLGLKIVLMDGEIVEIGGAYLDSEGYDFLALIVGSEGQFGIITEATLRILPTAARRAADACSASDSARPRASASPPSSLGHHSGRHRVHGQAGHRRVRGVRQGRLPARRRGAADRRGRRLARTRSTACLRDIVEIASAFEPKVIEAAPRAEQSAAHLEGAQGGLRRHRPHLRLLLHGRHHPARRSWPRCWSDRADLRRVRPEGREHVPRRRRQPASADPLQCQQRGRGAAGRAGGRARS